MQLRLVEYRRQENSPARRARRRRQFLHDSLQRHGISVHERSVWLRQSGHAHRHADRERPVSGRAYFQRRPRLRTSDGMAQEKTAYHHHVKSLHRVFTTKSAKVTKIYRGDAEYAVKRILSSKLSNSAISVTLR